MDLVTNVFVYTYIKLTNFEGKMNHACFFMDFEFTLIKYALINRSPCNDIYIHMNGEPTQWSYP